MFQKILQWIREVFSKMINHSSVKSALHVDIAISQPMAEALQLWSSMYENKAPWIGKDIRSLNLPSAIAGEIARTVTVEMQVEFSGSARADYLKQQFAPVLSKLREKVEVGNAKGGMVIKPYISGDNLAVDWIQADQFYPVDFDANGNITAIIFSYVLQVGDKYYTRLEMHQMGEHTDINGNAVKGCLIRNYAFRSSTQSDLGQPVPLASVAEWADIQDNQIVKGIDKPLYAYFRFPLANNIDTASPLGVSCFARAVDLIEQADRLYSNLIWEFESGKRAIFVDPMAFGKDKNGKPVLPDQRLFRSVDLSANAIGEGSSDDLFHDWTPDFREASIISGLDAILKKIEFLCGLAYGTISDPNVEAKTATEVTTTKQRTYSTITDTRKALQAALEQLLYAMDVWATLGKLAPKGTYQAAYNFDDSVIVDKDAQMMSDRQTATMGAMPKWMFLVRNYSLDEATAKKWIADAQAEQPQDMFGEGSR
jgi:A118 family predicted phage portal protein